MARNVRLNSAGISAVLSGSKVARVVHDRAVAVAARTAYPEPHSDGPVEVAVEDYIARGGRLVGSRAASAVIAKHPAALGFEAKHGTLLAAARETDGLDVTAR